MDKIRELNRNKESDHLSEWLPLLSEHLDNRLDEAADTHLTRHLAECRDCRLELAALRRTVRVLNALPEVKAPRSFTLTPAQAQRLRPRPLYRASQFAAAIAAAFLLMISALDLSGAFSQTVVIPVAATVPTVAVPEVGTAAARPCPTNGLNCAFSNGQVGQVVTATPDPTTPAAIQTAATKKVDSEAVRVIELMLVLVVVALAVFAFALRPRAPTRLKL